MISQENELKIVSHQKYSDEFAKEKKYAILYSITTGALAIGAISMLSAITKTNYSGISLQLVTDLVVAGVDVSYLVASALRLAETIRNLSGLKADNETLKNNIDEMVNKNEEKSYVKKSR